MPKLTIFAACDAVLFDDIKNPSLISVFSALQVGPQSGSQLPPDALAPKSWKIFTMWKAEDGDLGKTFTQKTTITTPDGKEFGNASEDFTMKLVSHSLITDVFGFPVGVEGDVVMTAWVEIGSKRITEIRKSEINVAHHKP